MRPAIRKLVLTVHLTSSLGWIGSVMTYLALGLSAATTQDAARIRAAWFAMELVGWWVLVPLAIASLLTGVVISLGTSWGLFRHYWVVISLALTIVSTAVLLLHMPTVSSLARLATHADDATLSTMGGDLFHPAVGLVVLLAITLLNVYKPRGLTPYGWRKQHALPHAGIVSALQERG